VENKKRSLTGHWPAVCLEGLRRTWENLIKSIKYSVRVSKPGPLNGIRPYVPLGVVDWQYIRFLILDFHRRMNTDFWFWGFCTVCKVYFLTSFLDPLWVPSLMVICWSVSEHPLRPYIRRHSTSLLTCAPPYDHWRWDPQRLPKRRQEIYLTHRAKSPKPKISIRF
jgi:hypothetical protein